MGTLTANQERLPGYCDHKLPTSCRLTSIPECCACADERTHAAAYSTYIDGVGFVQRGTRWQRYCWFCKEFWEHRVRASGLRPSQTRIPEVPDQTAFLNRWYEFHRGYRIVRKEDGSEERVTVLGEDLKDASPGFLPRTLEEMRTGRRRSDFIHQGAPQRPVTEETRDENGPSLQDTLDQMFRAASAEEAQDGPSQRATTHQAEDVVNPQPPRQNIEFLQRLAEPESASLAQLEGPQPLSNIHAQAMVPRGTRNREYQARRVGALRRELHRMRNGIERVISGLRELGENVPDHTEATRRLADLGRTLDVISGTPSREEAERAINSVNGLANSATASQTDRTLASIQARVDEARQHANEARRIRDQAASELDIAEEELRTSQQRLQQVQREQRTTENHIRLFGTREEMIVQGENYESPIGDMFSRAWERFRVAEEVRREERALRHVLAAEARAGGEEAARRLTELENQEQDVWGVPQPALPPPPAQRAHQAESEPEPSPEPAGELEQYYALLRRQNWAQRPAQDRPEQPILGDSDQHLEDETSTRDEDLVQSPVIRALVRRGSRTERSDDVSESMDISREPVPYVINTEAPRELQVRDLLDLFSTNIHATDVEFVLHRLSNDESLRATTDWSLEAVHRIVVERHYTNTTMWDRDRLRRLLRNEDFVWRAGLPIHRAARARSSGNTVNIFEDDSAEGVERLDNTEAMAEAFQMSSELRRRSGLTAPEQLRVLYRLQAGERCSQDRQVLQHMLRNSFTVQMARDTQRLHAGELGDQEAERHHELEQQRRDAAQQGDRSRQELNAQRQATQALAVAAGRTAMRTGPQALLARMADRDDEARAAYQRLQENGYTSEADLPTSRRMRETIYRPLSLDDYATASDSDKDKEEDEERGLDARDSGRPEPKTDEEMTVKMECRICYSQLADVACLPCGHLVMCAWCSEQHSPVMIHDRTRPRRAAGCPVCRKSVRQKIRVFRA